MQAESISLHLNILLLVGTCTWYYEWMCMSYRDWNLSVLLCITYKYHETAKFDFINWKFYVKLQINPASKLKK